MTINENGGKKDDSNKVRFDLLIPEFLKGFAEVMTHGANKYEAYNYLHLERWQIEAAHDRHFNAYRSGERNDPETDKSHLFHVACNTMMLWAKDNNFQGKIEKENLESSIYSQKTAASKLSDYLVEKEIGFFMNKQKTDSSIMISSAKHNLTILLYSEIPNGATGPIVLSISDSSLQYVRTPDQAIALLDKLIFNDPF
jgi:hypothetical protein